MGKTATELFAECANEMLRILESDSLTLDEVKEIHDSAVAVMLWAKAHREARERHPEGRDRHGRLWRYAGTHIDTEPSPCCEGQQVNGRCEGP